MRWTASEEAQIREPLLREASSSEDKQQRKYDPEAGQKTVGTPIVLSVWQKCMVASLTALSGASANIYVPVLPRVARSLNTSTSAVNGTLIANWVVSGLASFFWGPLSDSVGRLPTLTAGLIIFACGTVVSMTAKSVWFLLAGRALQGVGEGMGQTVSLAILRDCSAGDAELRRASIAQNQAILALAVACSPGVGGVLGAYVGWRSIFAFLLVWGMVCLVSTRVCLGETHPNPPGLEAFRRRFRDFAGKVASALTDLETRAAVFSCAALFGGRGCSITILTYTLQNYFNQSVLHTGFWLAVTGLGAFLGGSLQNRLFPTSTIREMARYANGATLTLFIYAAGVGTLGAVCLWGTSDAAPRLCGRTLAEPIVLDTLYRMFLTGTVPTLIALFLGRQPQEITGAVSGFYSGLKMFFFGLGSTSATLCFDYLTPNQPPGAPSVLFLNVALWVNPWLLYYWLYTPRYA